MDKKTGLSAMFAVTLIASPSLAQTTPVPSPDSKQAIPEKRGEPLQDGRSESLSKKLGKTDGVITPGANVDPGMRAPAPDPAPGTTPVIPPSATGGDNAK